MNDAVVDPATLLLELIDIPADRRSDRLRSAGPVEALLVAMGDQAERMATVDAGQAVGLAALVVELADEVGGAHSRARARRALAQTLAYGGRFPEALVRCEEAAAIAAAAGDRVESARCRLASLHALAHLGRFSEAVAAGETARQVFLDAGQPALAARADLNLGAAYAMRDEPRTALVHFDRARPALAAEPPLLAQLESNRGNALMSLDDFTGAAAAFRAAVASFAASGQHLAAAIAEGNLAYLATRQGLLPAALGHFEQARRHLETDEAPSHLARVLAEQAAALAVLGLPADAHDTYARVIPTLDTLGLAVEAAEARGAHAGVLLRLGRREDAEARLVEAGHRFDALGLPVGRARVDLLRAESLVAGGDAEGAQRMAEGGIAGLGDRPVERAMALALLARITLARGDEAATENALRTALGIADRYALAPVLADLYHTRGRLARRQGRTAAAREAFRSAITAIERVRGTLQAERFRTAFLGDRLAVYGDLALASLEAGGAAGLAEAFSAVERSRGRALLDLVGGAFEAESAAEDAAGASLRARLAQVRAELNWHYSRLAELGPGAPPPDRAWQEAVRDREREAERLEGRLAATRGIVDLAALPVGVAETMAVVPATGAAIAYFVAGDEVLAFLVRAGNVRVYRGLATAREVGERIRRFRFQVSRALAGPVEAGRRAERLLADARRELAALYALLLAPLRDDLSDVDRIAVVPNGLLHAIPFHALWDGERYLIERSAVVAAPSASLLVHLTTPRAAVPTAGRALVVGVEDELTPEIPREVARVAGALGSVDRLVGADATSERFAVAASGARLVHFAGHGRFSPDHPTSAGLRLADRWFTPRDLAGLRLRGAHVTLSGCETGRTAVAAGDELLGLVRGILSAGASSLLVSLWPVHDERTADLMADFYDRWRHEESIARAWQLAQQAAIVRDPHPAVWAPFVCMGGLA
ncbi:MAG TPA: CHAT domain-containing protein [Thermomicrobiales bacterium]